MKRLRLALVIMRRLCCTVGAAMLTACASPPPADYHAQSAHPFIVTEREVQLSLAGLSAADVQARSGSFAAARPNDGSSFTIRGNTVVGQTIKQALMTQGVVAGDIQIVAAEEVSITRIDHIGRAEGCEAAPQPDFALGSLDDGYSHSNADSALFGCAVRRNIAAMTADPRTLVAAMPASGRNGARAADVYMKWSKGEATQAAGGTAAASTSALPAGGAASSGPAVSGAP